MKKKDLENISAQWAEELKAALEHISEDWMDVAFKKNWKKKQFKKIRTMKFDVFTQMEYIARSEGTLILNIHALQSTNQTVLSETFIIAPYIKD